MTLKWIAKRLRMGTWTHLNHLLYWHRRVVGAKRFFRETQHKTFALARVRQFAAQGAIAGDASGSSYTTDVVTLRSADGFLHEHFDDGRLHAHAPDSPPLRCGSPEHTDENLKQISR